jgi:hypothetical protein
MAMGRKIVIVKVPKAMRDTRLPMGMEVVAKIGDKLTVATPTVTDMVRRAGVVVVEDVMVAGRTSAIAKHSRRSPRLVTRMAKKVKKRARDLQRSDHFPLRKMMTFPSRGVFLLHFVLSGRFESRCAMKKTSVGGSAPCGVNSSRSSDSKLVIKSYWVRNAIRREVRVSRRRLASPCLHHARLVLAPRRFPVTLRGLLSPRILPDG